MSGNENTPDDIPRDRLLFDSLVDNEKEYLRKVLKSKVFDDHAVYTYPCAVFIEWIFKQFEIIKHQQPSATALYNLEFLEKMASEESLFDQEYSEEKKTVYLKEIELAGVIDYEHEELDLAALEAATREYIQKKIVFFNRYTTKRMMDLYEENNEDEKKFFLKRLPFIMNNRTVFRSIKNMLEKMKSEKATQIWANVVISEKINEEKRVEILEDILKEEFEYVPMNFYK